MPAGAALQLRDVRRVFRLAGTELKVLDGVDLVLRPGEIVALVGPSGAGKSTLLHVAGLLERPDGGAVLIGDEDCGSLSDERRTERFLALTGIGTDELRRRAGEPALLSALIAFLEAHEPDLLSVSETIGVRADELVAARRQIDDDQGDA